MEWNRMDTDVCDTLPELREMCVRSNIVFIIVCFPFFICGGEVGQLNARKHMLSALNIIPTYVSLK